MSIAGDLAEERCERAFEQERVSFRAEIDYLNERLERYRKVAEAALEHIGRCADAMDDRQPLLAALAAVGMKVE